MDAFPFDLFGLMGWIFAITMIVTLAGTVLIVVAIVWAIRRGVPGRDDSAIRRLQDRLASGEISPVEYEVRMRALRDANDG